MNIKKLNEELEILLGKSSINEDEIKLPKIKQEILKMFPWSEKVRFLDEFRWDSKLYVDIICGDYLYRVGVGKYSTTVELISSIPGTTLYDLDSYGFRASGLLFTSKDLTKPYESLDAIIPDVIPVLNQVKDYIKDPSTINLPKPIRYADILSLSGDEYDEYDEDEKELYEFISSITKTLPKKLGKDFAVHQTDNTIYINYGKKPENTVFVEPLEDSTQILKIGLLDDTNDEIDYQELDLEDFGKNDIINIADAIKELFDTVE